MTRSEKICQGATSYEKLIAKSKQSQRWKVVFSQYLHCQQSVQLFGVQSKIHSSDFYGKEKVLINEFASETVGVCWMHSWVSTARTLSRLCALVTGNICPAFQALVSKLLLLIMYVAKRNKEVSYMGRNLKVK